MKNKKQAIAAINQGCQLEGKTINVYGNTCAIGALALAAGMTKKCITYYQVKHARKESIRELPEIAVAIEKKFGLDLKSQSDLQDRNDSDWRSARERRRAVINYLKNL